MTGGTSGIGYGITAHILQHNPSKIYILSNKKEHFDTTISSLAEYGDTTKVHWKQCDLEDLKQTLSVAQELKKELPRLDALVCNAGLGVGVYNESVDGIDTHFQVNHLSQMLLAMVLLPVLQQTAESRLVVQSSEIHRGPPSDCSFASLAEINTDIGPTYLYARSKLAQILFVRRLVKLLDQPAKNATGQLVAGHSGTVYINATHPGAVSTDQPKQAEDAYGTLGKIGVALMRPLMSDPVKQGCKSALFAATGQEVVEKGIRGQYIVPDKKVSEVSSKGQDEALAERLWVLSETLLEEKLGKLPYERIYI